MLRWQWRWPAFTTGPAGARCPSRAEAASPASRTTAATKTPTDISWQHLANDAGWGLANKHSFRATKHLHAIGDRYWPAHQSAAAGGGEGGQEQPTRENNKPAHGPTCLAFQAAAIAGEAPLARCHTWAHSISPRRRNLAEQLHPRIQSSINRTHPPIHPSIHPPHGIHTRVHVRS